MLLPLLKAVVLERVRDGGLSAEHATQCLRAGTTTPPGEVNGWGRGAGDLGFPEQGDAAWCSLGRWTWGGGRWAKGPRERRSDRSAPTLLPSYLHHSHSLQRDPAQQLPGVGELLLQRPKRKSAGVGGRGASCGLPALGLRVACGASSVVARCVGGALRVVHGVPRLVSTGTAGWRAVRKGVRSGVGMRRRCACARAGARVGRAGAPLLAAVKHRVGGRPVS